MRRARPRHRLRWRAVPALLAAGVVLAACGGSDGAEAGRATGRFAAVHGGACAAAAAAAGGDEAEAERRFADAHFGLHDLATAVEGQDRGLAARLLQAIERVESAPDPASHAALTAVVARAIEATGGTAPDRCPGDAASGSAR